MTTHIRTAARAAGALLVYALSTTTAFAGVLKKPYLIFEGDNTTMTVLWQDTGVETTNTIRWGTDASYATGSAVVPESGPSSQHKWKITGLRPATRYYYEVADAVNGVYGTGSFVTAPPADAKAVKFLAFGDTRSGPGALDGVAREMRKVYAADPAYQGINIQAGDWVSSDAESSWTAQWFNANAQTGLLLAEQPINGVKGNHENASGYSKYFPKYYPFPYVNPGQKAGDPASLNNLYWSFDYGPVHFTVVDQYSDYSVGSAQWNWVVNDLSTTAKPWKILMYHEPAWTAGTHGNNVKTQQVFDPIVKQYGVDLVYSGHNHNYARCQVADSVEAAGDSIAPKVPYVTNGGGGAGLYAVDTTNTGAYRHVAKALSEYEFLTFEIDGATLTMKAFAVTKADGTRLDALDATKNASTTSSLIEAITVNHPVAQAGGDRTVGTRQQCGLSLGGTATDADPVPLQYQWVEGATALQPWTAVAANGAAPLGLCGLSIGQHALTLQVRSDPGVTNWSRTASDSMVLTVVDDTPPVLSAQASKTVLWPPDHAMAPIAITVLASDNSGAKPRISAAVASNEPVNGLGDGNTASDWTTPVVDAQGNVSVQLRAERAGGGNGRIYTVSVTATDAAGNATTVPVNVSVPHDP
jgi:hypothetical protein